MSFSPTLSPCFRQTIRQTNFPNVQLLACYYSRHPNLKCAAMHFRAFRAFPQRRRCCFNNVAPYSFGRSVNLFFLLIGEECHTSLFCHLVPNAVQQHWCYTIELAILGKAATFRHFRFSQAIEQSRFENLVCLALCQKRMLE